MDEAKVTREEEEAAELRAKVSAVVGKLGSQIEEFAAASGPTSLSRRVSEVLATPPLGRRGGKLPPLQPILDKIQARTAELFWAQIFVRFMAWACRP